MPVLRSIRERFREEQPLAGAKVAACLHVTAETANLMQALAAGGAEAALCSANPLTVQDEVAAALVEAGVPVQATRGCPFVCQYCSSPAVFNGGYRKRPIDQIVRDVEGTRSRNINFCDDNLCEDVKFAESLFAALAGAPIRWGTSS